MAKMMQKKMRCDLCNSCCQPAENLLCPFTAMLCFCNLMQPCS